MRLFKSMNLKEAKDMYKKLSLEKSRLLSTGKDTSLCKLLIENILFFTENLTKDY
ncbi:MAG: hypothetical protein HFK08_05135 [Clostridia bacterium]|nr:hypothetical protein [Clostridia bacterium]